MFDTLKSFARLNKCNDANDSPFTTIVPAVLNSGSTSTATVTRFSCGAKVSVQGVMVNEGSHGVARSINGISRQNYIFNWIVALRANF